MRKIIFSVFILVTLIILFLLSYKFKSRQEQFFSTYSLRDEELEIIQEGDIILRWGFGLVSDMIVKTLREELSVSHCAIVVNDSIEGFKVIHTVSQSLSDFDGIQIQNLNTFVKNSKANSILVVRFKNADERTAKLIAQKARYYFQQKIPFDHSFDLDNENEFFCTELIWRIILDVFNIDIFENKKNTIKDYLKFSNFYDSDYFDVIINHHENYTKPPTIK